MANFVDPFGLIRQTFSVARWTERQIATLVGGGQDPAEDPPPAAIPAKPEADSLSSKMNRLLERALDQSTSSSQMELFHHILDQLVADEARIIGALSDGSSSPLVTVHDGVRRGVAGRAVLENASLIGRTANVALPAMVPTYVGHLLSLGLLEIGPEAPELKDDYEVLMAETAVLAAIKTASRGPLPAKVDKFTLTLSGLGHALWAATMHQDGP
jgi:abortive infection alpha-like protein